MTVSRQTPAAVLELVKVCRAYLHWDSCHAHSGTCTCGLGRVHALGTDTVAISWRGLITTWARVSAWQIRAPALGCRSPAPAVFPSFSGYGLSERGHSDYKGQDISHSLRAYQGFLGSGSRHWLAFRSSLRSPVARLSISLISSGSSVNTVLK